MSFDLPSPTGWWCWDCGYPALDSKPATRCRRCPYVAKVSTRGGRRARR